ncbi:MAG: hypothetical protein HUU29_05840, partial [Planctomycetaceae bacterium]|nr:hypothetical protein [Planctomycetaceae bacterium]
MSRFGWPIFVLTTALVLAGCQTYSPKPLDLERLKESWPLRDTNSEAVRAFAEKLETGAAQPTVYDPSNGVTLREAEIIALFFNAQLRVARLEAAVPLASAEHAGLWQDPELSADTLRVLDSVDEPWILGAGLSITIPLSGRLGAEEDKASAEALAALAEVREQEWL